MASVIIAAALALQTPAVQTLIAQKAAESLEEMFDGKIIFEKVHFKPFTTLVVKNLAVIDDNPAQDPLDLSKEKTDTLFKARYIIANFSYKSLTGGNGIHLDKVRVEDAYMNLVLQDCEHIEHKNKSNNLSRIFGLENRKKKEKKPTDKEIFHFKKVAIDNMTFRLINNSSYKTKYNSLPTCMILILIILLRCLLANYKGIIKVKNDMQKAKSI